MRRTKLGLAPYEDDKLKIYKLDMFKARVIQVMLHNEFKWEKQRTE